MIPSILSKRSSSMGEQHTKVRFGGYHWPFAKGTTLSLDALPSCANAAHRQPFESSVKIIHAICAHFCTPTCVPTRVDRHTKML